MLKRKVPLLKRYRQRFKVKPAPMWDALLVILLGCVLIYSYSFTKKIGFAKISESSGPAQLVRVQVLNGCGVSGMASKFAERLRLAGGGDFEFDVVDFGNFATFDVTESLVLDRGTSRDAALELASMFGLPRDRVLRQPLADNVLDIEVSILLGSDINYLMERRP
jgi:hypothetical protein